MGFVTPAELLNRGIDACLRHRGTGHEHVSGRRACTVDQGAYHANNQEPNRAQEPHQTQPGDAPQHDRHVDLRAVVCRLVPLVGVDGDLQPAGRQDRGAEGQVREHPEQHDGAAEALVVVLLLVGRARNLLRDLELGRKDAQLGFILGVQVRVVGGDVDGDLATRLGVGGRQLLRFVVALGPPRDIVGVAEGVNVENVDVRRRQKQVLDELPVVSNKSGVYGAVHRTYGSEHVPGIEE